MADDDDTDDEDKKFELRFNKFFHKGMSERDGRLEKSIARKFETMLASKFDELRTTLISTDEDPDPDVDEPGTPAGGGGAAGGGQMTPELRARLQRMEREAKEAKEIATRYQAEAAQERETRVRAEERQQLSSMLGPHVKPKMLEIAVDQLHARNLTRDEETGVVLWKSEDGTTLPLKDGISNWAKSDIGKEFAPPVEARSRGGRGPEGPNGIQPGKMTVEDLGSLVTGSIPGQNRGG